jgi:sterol 3beta-glucosyltransferase
VTRTAAHKPGAREYETVQSNSDPILGGSQAVLEFVTFSAISFTQLFTKPVCPFSLDLAAKTNPMQKKGFINTFYGIPKGAMGLMGDFYDGLEHGPKMLGSTVREPGKVDGVLSGTYQGVKGLFTGIYDGVTGLVTEPMEGHKKEVSPCSIINERNSLQGAIGAIKGSLRSRE